MDNKTFDSLLEADRHPHRAAAVVSGGDRGGCRRLLTRGGAEARRPPQACQRRGSKCNRNRQCRCQDESNVICDPLARGCQSGDRCCGVRGATCDKDCDCCKGYQCNRNKGLCVVAGLDLTANRLSPLY